MFALEEKIAVLRATTVEALRAKARVLLRHCYYAGDDLVYSSHGELLGWSIARDLCAGDLADAAD